MKESTMAFKRKDRVAFYGSVFLLSLLQQSCAFLLKAPSTTRIGLRRNNVERLPFLSTAFLSRCNSKEYLLPLFLASEDDDTSDTPFAKASAAFEAAHAEDPRSITVTTDGQTTTLPYSVHYHRRMAYWLDQLAGDDAPEAVKLAVRTQHIRRWTRPRADYPKGLVAYKKWRVGLQKMHSEEAAKIILDSGYDEEMATRVGELLRKQNLATDPDVQLLEDVICVVFLENEYTAFVEKDEYDDDKIVDIVQKTWKKMTPRGHEAALGLAGQLSERALGVVQRALEE